MTVLRLAAASAHFGRDLPRSIERISMVVTAARRAGASLVVLPDAALGGYLADLRSPDPDALPPALPRDAPQFTQIAAMLGDLVACIGYSEEAGGRRWNAAVCLSGDGVLGRYRKIHQPPGEALIYSPGESIEAFDTPVGRLGMLIDYDKTFPEAARTLALDGARIIACLCAWPASLTQRAPRLTQDRQSRLFDLYDCARAAENQVVWISANQTGSMGGLRFLGQSKIVGPGGDVLARTWAKAGLAVAELDVDAEIERARLVLHHLAERRPDLYRDK
ncbi:carbon-nitrogen hydrolase family protein [Jatrophihabitans endophyticus]|uniref:carbon-nitrogen hydrolase family protein n=1 Tax=Jatrophihabitans endophyticus TaxID=1206085 RepID=UPI0019E9829F|nr:carbon-nitrogen hydrolase family protein [Jatrophihabitans endophyticus]MBE7188618.1 carbon-nitrogen hydrolase family protein [Jatrophihabitans endophyticus]